LILFPKGARLTIDSSDGEEQNRETESHI
jgi:hypothetical protein